jgi:hypothetical protein
MVSDWRRRRGRCGRSTLKRRLRGASAAALGLPGVVQHSMDSLRRAAAEAVELGLGGIMIFGVPALVVQHAAVPVVGELVKAQVGHHQEVVADLVADPRPGPGPTCWPRPG